MCIRDRFSGKPDQATITALDSFQWRHGLQQTAGVLDVVTLNLLGLPSLGPELFQTLSGPQCLIDDLAEPPAWCEITKATPEVKQRGHDALHITLQTPPRASPRLIATALESNGMSSSNLPPTSSCW